MNINKLNRSFINYKFLMIGTGATGSQLLPFLCQTLNNYTETKDHKLILVDGDCFEQKNIRNQKCTYNDISRNKAEVLAERYRIVYNKLNITFLDKYILNTNDIITILDDSNYTPVIIGCVDNNATRKLLNEVFYSKRLNNLIYIDSGNGTINRTGQVVVGYKTNTTEQAKENEDGFDYFDTVNFTYKVLKPVCEVFPNILEDTDTLESLTSCNQIVDKFPQNIATNVLAATTVFTILNELISFDNINTHIAYFDAENSSIENVPVKYESYTEAFENKNNRIYNKNII